MARPERFDLEPLEDRCVPAGAVGSHVPPTAAGVPDPYEGATGNESIATATQLSGSLGYRIEAEIGAADDVDVFRFAARSTDHVKLSFTTAGLGGLRAEVAILDGAGAVVWSRTQVGTPAEDWSGDFAPPTDGDYYVRVKSADADAGGYRLDLEVATSAAETTTRRARSAVGTANALRGLGRGYGIRGLGSTVARTIPTIADLTRSPDAPAPAREPENNGRPRELGGGGAPVDPLAAWTGLVWTTAPLGGNAGRDDGILAGGMFPDPDARSDAAPDAREADAPAPAGSSGRSAGAGWLEEAADFMFEALERWEAGFDRPEPCEHAIDRRPMESAPALDALPVHPAPAPTPAGDGAFLPVVDPMSADPVDLAFTAGGSETPILLGSLAGAAALGAVRIVRPRRRPFA